MFDLLERASFYLIRTSLCEDRCLFGKLKCTNLDNSPETVTRVQGLNRFVDVLQAVDLMRKELFHWHLLT